MNPGAGKREGTRFAGYFVSAAMAWCAGCGTGAPLPPGPGAAVNQPPIIVSAAVRQLDDGNLRLSGSAFDPDGPALVMDYEQSSGPFAIPLTKFSASGFLSATLRPEEHGRHAFRITASDGFFVASADVTIDVTRLPGDPPPAASELPTAERPIPTGTFDVRFSGDVVADEGVANFALDGRVTIQEAIEVAGRPREIIVTLETDAGPFSTTSPAGAVTLSSVQSNRTVLAVELSGADIVLRGPPDAETPIPGVFKTGERSLGGLGAEATLVILTISGERISGTMLLSSSPVGTDALPAAAEYRGQITGQRLLN